MAAFTKATGRTIRPTSLADCSIRMETSIRGSGKMTKLTVLASTSTKMARFIAVIGKTTHNMVKGWRDGPTIVTSRAFTKRVSNRVKESSLGLTATVMKVTSSRTTFRV